MRNDDYPYRFPVFFAMNRVVRVHRIRGRVAVRHWREAITLRCEITIAKCVKTAACRSKRAEPIERIVVP